VQLNQSSQRKLSYSLLSNQSTFAQRNQLSQPSRQLSLNLQPLQNYYDKNGGNGGCGPGNGGIGGQGGNLGGVDLSEDGGGFE
jgi:hypothetical protein